MKTKTLFAFIVLFCMMGMKSFAYDFYLNGLYYNWINNKTEVEVTHYSGVDAGFIHYEGSITIPSSIRYQGKAYSVTSIGSCAFYSDKSVTSVSIPRTIRVIGSYAFSDTGVSEIIIPNSVSSIESSAFSDCSSLSSITIPKSVTSLGDGVFENCGRLPSITIPSSVTSIGKDAFKNCKNIRKVNIEDLTKWCEIKFGNVDANPLYYAHDLYVNNSKIIELTIPNSVNNINECAFAGCGCLSVTLPGSVTSIGNKAFAECNQLESFIIGTGVLSIGNDVFGAHKPSKVIWLTNTPPSGYKNACGRINYVSNNQYSYGTNKVYPFLSSLFDVNGIKYVPVSPSERTCDAIDCVYSQSTSSICVEETVSYNGISMSVKQFNSLVCYANPFIKEVILMFNGNIGNSAFENCIGIKKVTLKNAGYIGDNSFIGCTNLNTADINNQGYIGEQAFSGCSALNSVTINSQGSIRASAFSKCKNLSVATINNQGTIENNAFYDCNKLKTVRLGEKISSIGSGAFENCQMLCEIIIPDAVKSLGESVFEGCSVLSYAKIGNGVESIPYRSFYNCSKMKEVQMGKSVVTIGSRAFHNCSYLDKIIIPQSVLSINDYVFSSCTNLKNIIVEDGDPELSLGSNGSNPLFSDCPLDSVYIGRNISYRTSSSSGYSPFYRNTKLRSIKITNKETELPDNEFYGCTNLKNVSIGDGVTNIGNWVFSGCSNLDYFAFGQNVKNIGKEAFSDCTSVTRIISNAKTPPTCGSQALDDINKWNCTLSVPHGFKTSYQQADQWKDFFFINDDITGINTITEEQNEPNVIYNISGSQEVGIRHGINIIKMHDGTIKKILVK